MDRPICFVDTETTSLNPALRRPWEIAIIRQEVDGTEKVWRSLIQVDLSNADPKSLEIGGFWDRYNGVPGEPDYSKPIEEWPLSEDAAARKVLEMTHGATFVGAVPSFDAEILQWLLYTNKLVATWHHRLVCVETLASGHLGRIVGGLSKVADELEIDRSGLTAHTALDDARLAQRIYNHVIGGAK